MTRALVGHTGFVGGNLAAQSVFDVCFNSRNIDQMAGRNFDEVICAGVQAVKWKANKEPEWDKAGIKTLTDVLETVKAKRFILISTIDVYPVIAGEDETFDCHKMKNHAYGSHRLALEDFIAARHADHHIVRLPGLFGNGLKKNVIFDLLTDNCLETINPSSSFQYYDLERLTADLNILADAGIRIANLFTAPVTTKTIMDRFFPGKTVGGKAGAELHYDLKTCHDALFGNNNGYIMDENEVLDSMGTFIDRWRKGETA
ncbi:MAG: NAD(P)H-binding protein [Pseudomonadota bacterium]|nr:NAD(P)H-binding protein [Pseudomonadota bacterium]